MGPQHGVHDIPKLGVVLRSFNSFGRIGRARQEWGGLHRPTDPLAMLHAEAFWNLRNIPGLIQVDHAGIAVPLDLHTQVLLGFGEIYHGVFC